MMQERVEGALAAIPALLQQQDVLGLRSLLEDLYEAGEADALQQLRSVEQAAEAWGVSLRRARAHIAAQHAKFGVGRRLGGGWVLRASEIEGFAPKAKYRRK